MAFIGILAIAGIIAMAEVPRLRRKGHKKELWVFMLLLLLGTGISIAESLSVKVPNPIDGIAYLYKPINDFIQGILK